MAVIFSPLLTASPRLTAETFQLVWPVL